MKIAVGTRFFQDAAADKPAVMEKFIRQALTTSVANTYVAVDTSRDKTNAVKFINSMANSRVKAFPVVPWGKFVLPLNALIRQAMLDEATHILFASADIVLSQGIIDQLTEEMRDDTLVVGAALEGHKLGEGMVLANGVTVPWNTLALWNLQYLGATGVPLVGDAPFDPSQKNAGVEELATVAVLHALYPETLSVFKQIKEVPIIRDISDWPPDRQEAHRKKMASKIARPQTQMKWARLSTPKVLHIPLRSD